MKELELVSEKNNVRVDVWLAERLEGYSRSYIGRLASEEKIFINGAVAKAGQKLKTGDNVKILIPPKKELDVLAQDIDIHVLYEDDDIIVVNKPKGMVVHPAAGNYTGTLVNALLSHCKNNLSDINGVVRPGIVHRIDKDTSGVLVVAKNNTAHEGLSKLFKAHDIKRVYVALLQGIVKEQRGTVDAPIGRHPVDRKKMAVNTKNGRRAITHFNVLERLKDITYIEATLETGRTHQIRVHMSYIGHPVLGDEVYGQKNNKYNITGQALHAKTLGFVHPTKNKYIEFQAELPEYFGKILCDFK